MHAARVERAVSPKTRDVHHKITGNHTFTSTNIHEESRDCHQVKKKVDLGRKCIFQGEVETTPHMIDDTRVENRDCHHLSPGRESVLIRLIGTEGPGGNTVLPQ